jgi:hypothetical protein
MLGLAEVMHATSGAVLCHDETTATMGGGGWAELFHKIQRPKPDAHQQGTGAALGMNLTHPDRVATLCDWINDQALVGGDPADANPATRYIGNRQSARAQTIIRNGMRTLISLLQASRILEPNHTAAGELVFSGGSHEAVTYSAIRQRPHRGAKAGPGGTRLMPTGATLTYTTKTSYPGSAEAPLCFVFARDYDTTAGTITVTVDGVAQPARTISVDRPGADNWALTPIPIRFTGADIPAGAHTIVLTATGITGNAARFVRFWYEASTEHAPEVLCYQTVISNPVGFLFSQSTVSDFNFYNQILQDLCDDEFRPNVHYVEVDTLNGDGSGSDDPARGPYFTDTMHHTELGHAEYAIYGFQALTGQNIDPELRKRARRARPLVQDFTTDLSLSGPVELTSGIATIIPFNVELIDTSGLHDDQTNLGRLTVPTDGDWEVWGGGGFEFTAGTGVRMIWIRLMDGVTTVDQVPGVLLVTSGTSAFFPPSGMVYWSSYARAGQFFEFLAFQSSGGPIDFLDTGPIPRFGMKKKSEI